MSTIFWVMGVVFVLSLIPVTFLVIRNYLRFRRRRSVVCPETFSPETLKVDAAHAAWTSAAGEPELRLTSCSRSPRHLECGQSCLVQVDPEQSSRSEVATSELSHLAG
jgi:hypothetical protein